MSGRRSRDKSNRTERAIVRLLQAQSIAATKIRGMYRPGADIGVPKLGADTAVEMKCCVTGFDAAAFTSKWGEQALTFGWTARELFGLPPIPSHPTPSYRRLSSYDQTGLIWLLRGRPVVALTETAAAIQGATSRVVYRKAAVGPVGDSLDDWVAAT